MTDAWEGQFGLNPLDATDAQTDSDGDGLSNLREFELGTDPRNRGDPASQAPAPRLVNISTRGQVQTDDRVMIGGVIISGSEPKTVLIRARGPSLTEFGVVNALEDPFLQLFSGSTQIAVNDAWQTDSQFAQIPAHLAPTNPKEAAILTTLTPGPYTAIVSGAGGLTGVGIVEIFEMDSGAALLANISTRGFVGLGDDVLIGGVIISGTSPKMVSIRARGPSLEEFGVDPALQDPTLEVFDVDGQLIDSNDNWESHNSAGLLPASLAPARSSEAAVTLTLDPGAYTAVVRGQGAGTGVGIVEVFEVNQ